MEIIEIEIDPSANAGIILLDDMVPPDITMFLAVIVKEFDGLCKFDKLIQDFREIMVKIFLMVAAEKEHAIC
jgi:hypothetical protein